MKPVRRVDLLLVLLGLGLVGGGGVGAYRYLHNRATGPSPNASASASAGSPKDFRLVPVEAYMRTYLQLFGGLAPLAVQQRARGPEKLFDTWDDYVSSLGLPDYKIDAPRQTQTNALMVATFERLGVALCDRAAENDLEAKQPVPVDKRVIFAFDVPKGELDAAGFAPRFDVLHRTFLGYPASLAPAERTTRFFDLYRSIVSEHESKGEKSKLKPEDSGWAAVCYGLVRHPEFHLY